MKSGELKKGINFHNSLKITEKLGIMFRDLPPDDIIDCYRIDIRKRMDSKRLLKIGLYFDDEQFVKVFEKVFQPYYYIVKKRLEEK